MSIANTNNETIITAGIIENNDQVQARVEHLKSLENLIGNSYPNKFERSKISGVEDTISNLLAFAPIKEIADEFETHKKSLNEGEKPDQELKAALNEKLKEFGNVRISGRLAVPPRVMGKAAFVHLSDGKNRLQLYFRKGDFTIDAETQGSGDAENNAKLGEKIAASPAHRVSVSPEESWNAFKFLDHGDFVGAEGFLFLTNTGELSVHVETFQFLSKSLLPMPDKMHGIADPELRRRYRYADLIASSLQVEHEGLTTREVFERRAKLISGMRRFLDDAGYIEVETPMLSPKATGAAATPFETYHNALDIPLYARIAPELYLKRLTVGGFEKVYELNRNFRNEGLSHKHNPEFTMLEFYCAYMDVNGMMDFAEAMIKESVQKATGGSLVVNYDGKEIDFSKFERISMKDAVVKHLPSHYKTVFGSDFSAESFNDASFVRRVIMLKWIETVRFNKKKVIANTSEELEIKSQRAWSEITEALPEIWEQTAMFSGDSFELSDLVKVGIDENDYDYFVNLLYGEASKSDSQLVQHFERFVEPNLIQPTFIIDYPKSISPLSKASPENPQIAERFELFINGMECANGFSELNDPQEQFERFVDQMKERESGDAEAMVLDEDYIRALAYGMPPAAGIGIGIDRLVMLLTNKHSIRDVILFPHMRPVVKEEEEKKSGGEEEKA